jgi:hypothetical protein
MTRRILAGSCCTTPSAMGFWAAAFVVLYGVALLLASVWSSLGPYGDTLILAALGTALHQLQPQSHIALRNHGTDLPDRCCCGSPHRIGKMASRPLDCVGRGPARSGIRVRS